MFGMNQGNRSRGNSITSTVVWTVTAALIVLGGTSSAEVFRVDPSATSGTQDGLTWPNAFLTLQPAVDAAGAVGGEVWVAGGPPEAPVVYAENRTLSWGGVTGSLVLRSNAEVYGGFEGYRSGTGKQESDRSQRDRAKNVSIIDGSVARGGNPAYHVVVFGTSTGPVTGAVLDGFTVTGGKASGLQGDYHTWRGGAVFNWQSTPLISNCILHENTASVSGGAVANVSNGENNAAAVFLNCLFYDNNADRGEDTDESPIRGGGAVFNNGADAVFTGCTLSANTTGNAQYTLFGAHGGAMYNWNSSPSINSCVISDNDSGIQDDRPYDSTAASVTAYTDASYAHQEWAPNGDWTNAT